MQKLNKPIGILGGTFDPIHFGHLRMGLELLTDFNLEKVHLIPCYQPVHRDLPSASPQARINMIEMAIQDEPNFHLDLREMNRQGPSYFIDTLISLRDDYPQTPLCAFIGLDVFLSFTSWFRYLEILNYAHIILAHRPQYQLPESGFLADFLHKHRQYEMDYIHQHLSGSIILHPITLLEISSSEIRKQIQAGKSPRYLLPNRVYDYIRQHSIYTKAE